MTAAPQVCSICSFAPCETPTLCKQQARAEAECDDTDFERMRDGRYDREELVELYEDLAL